MRTRIRNWLEERQLPRAAKAERQRDRQGLPAVDPGTDRVLPALMAWMAAAQDHSRTRDGGVARDFSLVNGWASSYPETTGYIVPTFLAYAERTGELDWRTRGLRMADWLVSIQLPDGGFQGGKVDSTPVVPVTFNTGQILLGLAAAERATGQYRDAMRRAADWLVRTQDPDGCWRNNPTPFAAQGEKVYETHVAWGLLEAARVDSDRGYAEAALANVRWALRSQSPDGFFRNCCLDDPAHPLTHTLGYALRGLLEAYAFTADPDLLAASLRTADGLLSALRPDGHLPGRMNPDWTRAVDWVCLTGSAQVAHCWLLLYQHTNDSRYREAAACANSYVRRTVRLDGSTGQRGGVKGSFPVDGDYGRYQFLNWAPKFLADSLMLEADLATPGQ